MRLIMTLQVAYSIHVWKTGATEVDKRLRMKQLTGVECKTKKVQWHTVEQ
jgi:hypothetical protein